MLIARRLPVDHPNYNGPDVQVWRVVDQGYGVEVLQYVEHIDHNAAATTESALTAAGYTVAGPWKPEADTEQARERMPLTADARGFIMRMFRLYVRPGPCHAAEPDAAGVVQTVLARLLLVGQIPADTATLPSHYRAALRERLAELTARAARPPQPGHTPPEVCQRAAKHLARIIRTLETEYAESF
ncbi:hypothetical protein [Nocardia sp. CA-120079]|uniref:hypothetical protein n=1 Tax=Nocardia sp. CA-120079 TaxID=3239974 RepID=UPI003D95116B